MTVTERLLGRAPELARLRALLDEAADGHQQVALVSGDPGIGKTSLVAALATGAAEAGMEVVWGRCWEGGGAAPFWPWAQALRSCLERVDDDLLVGLGPAAADLAQLVPELGTGLPAPPATTSSDSPDARLRVFDSVAAFLAAIARQTGLLVVLDDVHAADEGSLQLLRYLARRAAPVPLVIVATYRITEVVMSEVHSVAIEAVARCGTALQLRGLPSEDVAALLERAGASVGAVDVRRVQGATDGNPFLVYEAARLLAAAAPGRQTDVVLPTDARALIHQRLEPVPPEVRDVLAAAAVLGRDFDLGPLSRVLDRPADELIDVLSAAADLAVVEELRLGRWSFTHALLREALRDELGPDDRARLHRRAGEVLQAIHGGADGPAVAQMAEHFHAALAGGGDPSQAVELCARAAAVATTALAHEEAARWYERALEALELAEPVDERRRYDLLVGLAGALNRQGKLGAATETHQKAIRAARAMGSVELAAKAAVEAAPLAVSDPLVIGALDDALCDLPEEDSPLRARVLVSFARALGSSYLTREVLLDISNQGLEMARRLGDPETQWWTLWQWHQNAFPSPETLDERHRVAGELMEIARRSGDLERRQLARQLRAANLFEAGDLPGGRAELETRLREAQELRQPFYEWQAITALANVAISEGRLDEGERLARQAAAMGEEFEWVIPEIELSGQLLLVRRHQGAFDDLERLAYDALDAWTVSGFDCRRQHSLLLALIHLGKVEEARSRLDALVGPAAEKLFVTTDVEGRETPIEGRWCCMAAVADLSWLLDDAVRAQPLHDRLLPRRGFPIVFGNGISHGAADRYLGQLATVLGRADEADEHFEAAHRIHDRMRTPIWGAYGRADHARMLELRGAPGDRARAVELLDAAAASFGRLGMGFYERQARERLESLTRADRRLAMHKQGESWAVTFEGAELRVRDSKGMRYLARLVTSPGQEVHALDLVVGDGRGAADRGRELEGNGAGDAGAVLDPQAKAAYRRRLEELRQGDLAGDVAGGDVAREIAFLEAELGAAVGLGGRDRRAASDAERARQSVTKAIKEAVDRLSHTDAGLGRHLRAAVRTGVYSSYAPG